MEDFHKSVEKSLQEGSMEKLLDDYCAHTRLNYQISDRPVTISPAAFYEDKGGKNSLEYIFNQSRGNFPYEQSDGERGIFLATEIAFTGIIDPKKLRLHEFIAGDIGGKDMCDWTTGELMEKSQQRAKELSGQISLGHTHPVIVPNNGTRKEYGAMPSNADWNNASLSAMIDISRRKGNELGEWLYTQQLRTGVSNKFGGDYGEMRTLEQAFDFISPFGLIASPALNQLGIFEVKEKGKVVYHPWKVA